MQPSSLVLALPALLRGPASNLRARRVRRGWVRQMVAMTLRLIGTGRGKVVRYTLEAHSPHTGHTQTKVQPQHPGPQTKSYTLKSYSNGLDPMTHICHIVLWSKCIKKISTMNDVSFSLFEKSE